MIAYANAPIVILSLLMGFVISLYLRVNRYRAHKA